MTEPELLKQYELEVAERAHQPILIETNILEVVCLVGAVQLATRHPGFTGQSRQVVEAFIRELQAHIAPDPESAIAEIFRRGRHEDYDVSF